MLANLEKKNKDLNPKDRSIVIVPKKKKNTRSFFFKANTTLKAESHYGNLPVPSHKQAALALEIEGL